MTHLILENTSYLSVLQAQYLDTYSRIGSSRTTEASPKTPGEASSIMNANGTYEREPAFLLAG